MSITPENAASSWRDLSDQLTSEQAKDLANREMDPDNLVRLTGDESRRWTADALLQSARRLVAPNLGAMMIGDVGAPAGAVRVFDWDDASDTRTAFRRFKGSRRVVVVGDGVYEADVEVCTGGTQYPDGTCEREITVHQLHGTDFVTPRQARELAAALIEAADELDALAQR